MFSRRAEARLNRGRISTGAGSPPVIQGVQQFGVEVVPSTLGVIRGTQSIDVQAVGGTVSFDPLGWKNILTAAGVGIQLYFQGDVGIAKTGTNLTGWTGQDGAGTRNITVADAPQVNTTGLNGRGTVLCDGVNDLLNVAWDPPAPGTTKTWWYIIANQRGWTAGRRLMGGNGTTMRIGQQTATPQIQAGNTALVNDLLAMTNNTWFRVECLFGATAGGGTGDFLKVGSTGGTRTSSFGNSDPTGLTLCGRTDGDLFGNYEIALVIACSSEPTAPTKALLDALTVSASGGYGSGVQV